VKPVPWGEVRRLIVCRTDHVGDLVVSSGAFRALRRHLPDTEIWAVVNPAAREWISQTGWVDRALTLADADLLPVFQADTAVGLSPRSATHRLLRRSKARWKVGYTYTERPLARLSCAWLLTHTWVTSVQRSPRHEAEVVRDFLQASGFSAYDPQPGFPLPPKLEEWGRVLTRGRTVLHFAPRWLASGWQLADFYELAARLAPCLVTYGAAERSLLPQTLPGLPGVEWLGDLSLMEWAAVLGGASAVVSTDTGAVHVAAALGRPVVVVYLANHFQLCSRQWYPWGVRNGLLRHGPAVQLIPEICAAHQSLIPAR
jgi:ADP-heptose:LPS heptosyltransferase